MRPRNPGAGGVRFGAALAPLVALAISCGSGTNNAADGGPPARPAGPGATLTVTTDSLPGRAWWT